MLTQRRTAVSDECDSVSTGSRPGGEHNPSIEAPWLCLANVIYAVNSLC